MIINLSTEKKSFVISRIISEIVSLRQKLEYITDLEIQEILREDLGE